MYKHIPTSIFIILILTYSYRTLCSNSADLLETAVSLITQTDTGNIKVNTTFPFGCPDLTKYQYPIHWEGDLVNYGQLKQPSGQQFENIRLCFAEINAIETNQLRPEILIVKQIKIGEDLPGTIYFDTISQSKIDSLKYRLPDIGNYQSYYFYEQSKNIYGQYGNLLLLDSKSKTGIILNVYYEVGGEQNINFRYFYLDGKKIKIYEGSCYDDGCSLIERFHLSIKSDRKIIIKALK